MSFLKQRRIVVNATHVMTLGAALEMELAAARATGQKLVAARIIKLGVLDQTSRGEF